MIAYRYRRGGLVGLVLGLAGLGAVAAAQEQEGPDSAALVELNRAIKAYLDQKPDVAAEGFEQLLAARPTAAYRVTCHYYLGLIGLEQGLRNCSEAQTAAARQAVEEATAAAASARHQFEQAQKHFAEVISLVDPTAEMINAALLLGIAQLASDFPGTEVGDKQVALELARRAEDTLNRYVTQTEPGREDRYGRFYLAVARYRLADHYRREPGRSREFAESLAAAKQDLEQSLAQAEADQQAGKLTPEAHERFKTVVTYYDALLAILERDSAGARQRFATVTERVPGTDLAKNAQAIIDKLDELETTSPLPIRLEVPGPIGPLEFEGRVRVGNWYDSNVILLGKETTLPRGFKRKDDYQFGISADFNISRYISKTEAPWVGESLTIGLGGGTSNLWQPNIPEFDVNRYPGRAYLNWQPIRDLYLGLQYEYSYTQLGHEPFISSHRVTPVISKLWRVLSEGEVKRDWGRTDLYYTHDDRDYQDRLTHFQLNRDGTYQALGVQHTLNLVQARDLPYLIGYYARHDRERQLFGEDWLNFYVGYEYRDERTAGTEFDLRGHSLVWGLDVPLPHRFAFELDGEFTWADYTGASLFDFERKERADLLQRYKFGLTYSFIRRGEYAAMRTLDVKLRTGIELTFQNSNIWDRLGEDIYEYDRAVYGVQLEADF
jgi:hypothetical protein